jgi:hypothetical protein
MKTIKVSQAVWDAIAARGKFGETENDVLARVFGINPEPTPKIQTSKTSYKRSTFATRKMSSYVRENKLYVQFHDGPSNSWQLPARENKTEIRKIRDEAVAFARQNGAAFGQEQAVKKALTDAGYWLTK